MRGESVRRAQRKYARAKVVRKTLALTRTCDADILARLDEEPNFCGYVKELIRRDIAKRRKDG